MATCDRIMASLVAPVEIQGTIIDPGASIGVAVSREAISTADRLLRDADVAMYAAKAAGKGNYKLFAEAMDEPAFGLRMIEPDLARVGN